jgi:hypothetical protein
MINDMARDNTDLDLCIIVKIMSVFKSDIIRNCNS